MKSLGVDPCPYPDYKTFVKRMFKIDCESQDMQTSTAEKLKDMNERVVEIEREMKRKMSEVDHEKSERKLMKKFEEKLVEIKE